MTAFNRHARGYHARVKGRPSRRRWLTAALFGVLAVLALPALAAGHPLGNFTINHYAGLRVEPGRILLDVVIDQAEIPAFQARLAFDTDADGELSDAETEAGRVEACRSLAASLDLRIDDVPQRIDLTEAGLMFPAGAGGLTTMRSTCGFAATMTAPLTTTARIAFADRSFSERLGWREIVVEGSGVTVATEAGDLRSSSPSERLTAYPAELLTRALADTEIVFLATLGGPSLRTLDIPDADALAEFGEVATTGGAPLDGNPTLGAVTGSGTAGTDGTAASNAAAVPGGVTAADLPEIFRTADLTPFVLLASILTAAALGAGHALTPGHGKTLMAAYLVGTRGTSVHAAGLGLSVALSHTLGILALAGLVVGAQGLLPPDVVVRTAPVIAAGSIVVIGGWMLLGETRRRVGARTAAIAHDRAHATGNDHHHAEHEHDADHHHDSGTGEHSHGGVRHSHLPPAGSTISWRSLFVLGLAGGLIPSASALLILLGSIAAGRPAFGFVLVLAFGLGMALVMGGIGLALVIARGRLDRVSGSSALGRASSYLPLVASFLVLGFGLYLTVQAVSGNVAL